MSSLTTATKNLKPQINSAYRSLLRAQRFTFKGDTFALQQGHQKIRAEFFEKEYRSDLEVKTAIRTANEIAAYLRQNVVQATMNPNDRNAYELKITPETELNDNGTIKKKLNTTCKKPRYSWD